MSITNRPAAGRSILANDSIVPPHLKTQTLQEVMLVDGYSVEPRIVGNEWNRGDRQVFKRDGRRSVTFDLGLGGDASAYDRCSFIVPSVAAGTYCVEAQMKRVGANFNLVPASPDATGSYTLTVTHP